ncbi:MAG: DUF892 family protein [Thermomicrobiales bacterium]|nr:DUF892 family protein [Thermomicrobiales bacterium]
MATDKTHKTIADDLERMVALEERIEAAMDHQLNASKNYPEAHAAIQRFHTMVRGQRDELKTYRKQYGETAGSKIKGAGSAVRDVAADLVDKMRGENVARALRADYTVFNHAAIGYTALYATADALGDADTADIARRGLTKYAGAIQEINHILGDVVVAALRNDGHQIANANAGGETRAMVDAAWRANPGLPVMAVEDVTVSEASPGF